MSAIEYWRRHKLEYCWLGLVKPEHLSEIHHRFLGMGDEEPNMENLPTYVRRLRSRLELLGFHLEASALSRYFEDSALWLNEVLRVLSENNGTAYVVVGCNLTRGIKINTARALQDVAKSIGLKCKVLMRYRIVNYHMQYPTRQDIRIRTESVLKLAPM
jgi:hypothetical protein